GAQKLPGPCQGASGVTSAWLDSASAFAFAALAFRVLLFLVATAASFGVLVFLVTAAIALGILLLVAAAVTLAALVSAAVSFRLRLVATLVAAAGAFARAQHVTGAQGRHRERACAGIRARNACHGE